jgi:hypothetical protein
MSAYDHSSVPEAEGGPNIFGRKTKSKQWFTGNQTLGPGIQAKGAEKSPKPDV